MPAKRRALLAAVGSCALAGCLTAWTGDNDPADPSESNTPTDGNASDPTDGNATDPIDANATDPTEENGTGSGDDPFEYDELLGCPTSQRLDVEWPSPLTAASAESYVVEYESAYFREIEVDWEPVTSVDTYDVSVSAVGEPEPRGDGYVVELELSGRVHNLVGLEIFGRVQDPPSDASVVPVSDIDDDRLSDYCQRVVTDDPESLNLWRDETDLERYLDLFEATFDDYETIIRETWDNRLYVDVDGTTIEINVGPASTGYEYWPRRSYYVDDQILVRAYGHSLESVTDGEPVRC